MPPGIGKMSTKSAAAKSHAVHEMDFWMQERSRCKAAAQAAMAAGCVLQKPRARRMAVAVAVAHLAEAADDGTDCEMDDKESDAETVDGEAFVIVGSSIVDAFQNGSAPPGPAERTNPLVAMVLAGLDALRVAAGAAWYQCAAGPVLWRGGPWTNCSMYSNGSCKVRV